MTQDLQKYVQGIRSTGFGLEHEISEFLREQGWNIINNKYYVDDVQGSVREIDILAYRARAVEHINVYTVIIISCKKSSKNVWALLSKEKRENDPNMNWNPIQNWTNEKIMKFSLSQSNWKEKYLLDINNNQVYDSIIHSDRHIFAFQELNAVSGNSQDDRAIFSSISSLMKAQGYEITSLNKRKSDRCFYNFNLVSLVDSDLIRLDYEGDEITPIKVADEKFIGSYIINQTPITSRVHFICKKDYKDILKEYNSLHNSNCAYVLREFNDYYKDAIQVEEKRKIFEKELFEAIVTTINLILLSSSIKQVSVADFYLYLFSHGLEIRIENENDFSDKLNNSETLIKKTRKALKKLYRYEGDFRYIVNAYASVPF